MKIAFQIAFILLVSISGNAQNKLKIGEWESHLPNKSGLSITQTSDYIYYASTFGLVKIFKEDLSYQLLDKTKGLSDVEISKVLFNEEKGWLILAYKNGKIDIINGDQIIYISDLFTNTNIQGSREIFDVFSSGSNVYFAASFGVVEFDLETLKFGFTSFSEEPINHVFVQNDIIYAGSNDGLYSFDLTSNMNPANFAIWKKYDESNDLPVLYEVRDIYEFNEELHLATATRIFKKQDNIFQEIVSLDTGEIRFLSSFKDTLLFGSFESEESVDLVLIKNEVLQKIPEDCTNFSLGALEDQYQRLWIVDQFRGFRYLTSNFTCEKRFIEGPFSQDVSELEFANDQLFVAPGGVSDNYTYLYDETGYYTYDLNTENWSEVNQYNNAVFSDSLLINMFRIAHHPFEERLVIGSFFSGLAEHNLETGEVKVFTENNSSLQGAIGDELRIRISGLTYDDEGNLWVSNHGAGKPLSVYTKDGIWYSFNTNSTNKHSQIAIDRNGYKWVLVEGVGGGVYVFDEGENIADPSDDQEVFLKKSDSEIEGDRSFCIEADREGNIWLGTNLGPVVFECGSNVFDYECLGNRRRVTQDGIPAILLATEDVRCMAFDGANRMWVGTKNGVFVLSPDSEKQLYHYTVENSPIYDNSIIDIEYDESKGRMFIATDKGMLSLRIEAIGANRTHNVGEIYAFPNPVRPEYDGPIAIKGLGEDVNVKITDINGVLMHETTALGGQAIWDGKDYNGTKASTGVYLVFSSTTDTFSDPDTYVTKILVVK